MLHTYLVVCITRRSLHDYIREGTPSQRSDKTPEMHWGRVGNDRDVACWLPPKGVGTPDSIQILKTPF